MARSDNNLQAVFQDTANAIRSKTGKNGLIVPRDFADEVASIETGIEPSGTLDISENGTYNVTNYASANVEVSLTLPNILDLRGYQYAYNYDNEYSPYSNLLFFQDFTINESGDGIVNNTVDIPLYSLNEDASNLYEVMVDFFQRIYDYQDSSLPSGFRLPILLTQEYPQNGIYISYQLPLNTWSYAEETGALQKLEDALANLYLDMSICDIGGREFLDGSGEYVSAEFEIRTSS